LHNTLYDCAYLYKNLRFLTLSVSEIVEQLKKYIQSLIMSIVNRDCESFEKYRIINLHDLFTNRHHYTAVFHFGLHTFPFGLRILVELHA